MCVTVISNFGVILNLKLSEGNTNDGVIVLALRFSMHSVVFKAGVTRIGLVEVSGCFEIKTKDDVIGLIEKTKVGVIVFLLWSFEYKLVSGLKLGG